MSLTMSSKERCLPVSSAARWQLHNEMTVSRWRRSYWHTVETDTPAWAEWTVLWCETYTPHGVSTDNGHCVMCSVWTRDVLSLRVGRATACQTKLFNKLLAICVTCSNCTIFLEFTGYADVFRKRTKTYLFHWL